MQGHTKACRPTLPLQVLSLTPLFFPLLYSPQLLPINSPLILILRVTHALIISQLDCCNALHMGLPLQTTPELQLVQNDVVHQALQDTSM